MCVWQKTPRRCEREEGGNTFETFLLSSKKDANAISMDSNRCFANPLLSRNVYRKLFLIGSFLQFFLNKNMSVLSLPITALKMSNVISLVRYCTASNLLSGIFIVI